MTVNTKQEFGNIQPLYIVLLKDHQDLSDATNNANMELTMQGYYHDNYIVTDGICISSSNLDYLTDLKNAVNEQNNLLNQEIPYNGKTRKYLPIYFYVKQTDHTITIYTCRDVNLEIEDYNNQRTKALKELNQKLVEKGYSSFWEDSEVSNQSTHEIISELNELDEVEMHMFPTLEAISDLSDTEIESIRPLFDKLKTDYLTSLEKEMNRLTEYLASLSHEEIAERNILLLEDLPNENLSDIYSQCGYNFLDTDGNNVDIILYEDDNQRCIEYRVNGIYHIFFNPVGEITEIKIDFSSKNPSLSIASLGNTVTLATKIQEKIVEVSISIETYNRMYLYVKYTNNKLGSLAKAFFTNKDEEVVSGNRVFNKRTKFSDILKQMLEITLPNGLPTVD